jgi:hypothetical protein
MVSAGNVFILHKNCVYPCEDEISYNIFECINFIFGIEAVLNVDPVLCLFTYDEFY